MPKRETSKTIDFAERKWEIRKFDAMTGSFIATKLLVKLSRIAFLVMGDQKFESSAIMLSLADELSTLSKQEFFEIQSDCIDCINVVDSVGGKDVKTPLRTSAGWTVKEMETDVLSIMTLTIHVLVFNFADFFAGNALKESIDSIKPMIPSSASISTDSPSAQ